MKTNARVSRFASSWEDKEIDALVERPALQLALEGRNAQKDADLFEEQALQLFLATPQLRCLLRFFVDVARAHAEINFADDEQFKNGLYLAAPWGEQRKAAICLTGLAGVGKSELIRALRRLLRVQAIGGVSGVSGLSMTPLWFATMEDGSGLRSILSSFLKGGELLPGCEPLADDGSGTSVAALLSRCRRRAWREAVCLLLAEEFQLLAKGNACVMATTILLKLLSIGPRLVFCANYSLCHKLQGRDSEDQQRLLPEPVVLRPERQGSPEFLRLVQALQAIAPDIFTFDAREAEKLLHDYTFGVKRSLVKLLKRALFEARSRSRRGVVGIDEIKKAYASLQYSVISAEVELLWDQLTRGKCLRKDLWCPFDGCNGQVFWGDVQEERSRRTRKPHGTDIPQTAAKVMEAEMAVESLNKRVNDALIEGAMTPAQVKAVKALSPAAPVRAPSKVIRFPSRRVTKEDLLAGADAIDDLD